MLRLFGSLGALMLATAGLALFTSATLWRILTGLIGLLIIGLYLYMQRSLPPRRGRLNLPGLQEPVEVFWDDRAVPHIYARTLHDLYFAQGYVTARERLWSMDLDRRAASGRLAEIYGPKLLPVDRHFRTLGLRRAAQAAWAAIDEDSRNHLEAYTKGINACISAGCLHPEFALSRRKPEPWTPVDSLVIGKLSAYGLSSNWEGELFRAHLVQAVGAEKAAELFVQAPDLAYLRELEQMHLPDAGGLLEMVSNTLKETVGSNAWVVSGERTRSGAPILANDPHLAVRNPCVWYQCHLVGPGGLDVIGVTMPGIPGIMLGHNREIAWGATNLNGDVQDVYVEKLHPSEPGEYWYRSRWEPAERIVEPIVVRGEAEPVLHEVLVTRHGPIIARDGETALALRWTALEATNEVGAFLAVNQARSWKEFREAVRPFAAPAQNFVVAGRDGTIAWRAQGRLPVRAKGDGQVPVPGWTGEYEWTGCIPHDQLPETVNPADGFIACANQDVTPEGYPHTLGSAWAAPYRSQRISELLRGATDVTPERTREVQTDLVSVQARQLVQMLLANVHEGLRQGPHTSGLNDVERRALLVVSAWDCQELPESPGAALWHQWYLFLVEGIFRPQMGLELFDQFVACGSPTVLADRLIMNVAQGGQSQWLEMEGPDGLPQIALRSFRRAVALLAAKQGSTPEVWRWGREHTIRFEHPLSVGLKILRPFFDIGPYRVGGSATTVNNHGYSQLNPFGVTVTGCWRHIVDMARVEGGLDICAPGQSGHPLSPHHADQVVPWLRGEYHLQVFKHGTIRELPCLVLQPPKA